jgi:hypothetical protein
VRPDTRNWIRKCDKGQRGTRRIISLFYGSNKRRKKEVIPKR